MLVLIIVCAGVVLASLDLFIVNVALPSLARDLHERNLSSLSWVLNAYTIVYASLLVLFGRLSESRRREHGFLLGAAVFTASSAACGMATSLPMLVAFRIVQAAGAALLTPTSLSLILSTAPAEKRPSAVRAWTAVGGLAAALGPVIGGFLVAASWRWAFLVNVPIGVAAIAIGWRRLPAVPGHPAPRPDAFGAVLITAGVALLTLGLVEGNHWGWGSARVVGALASSMFLIGAFIARTAHYHNPLVEPALFKIRSFTGSSTVAFLFSTAFGAMLLSIVLWMQNEWGWSALHTGLAFAPGPLMVPVFSFLIAGRMITRFGPGRVIGAGATIYAAGIAWWALRAGLHPDYVGQVLPGTLMTGAGVGLTLPTFMATGAGSLPPQSFATGSAVVNMLRQVGLAVGVAVLIAILGSPHSPARALSAFQAGWAVTAAVSLGAAAAGAVLLRTRAPRIAAMPTSTVIPAVATTSRGKTLD